MRIVTLVVTETAKYSKSGIEVPPDVDLADPHTRWELWSAHGGTDRNDLDSVDDATITVTVQG